MRLLAVLLFAVPTLLTAAERNIIFFITDDESPTLGCYGDDYAITPHIDHLATEGVRYTHAFATAPVCSPARSCLITGCYATSLGTHNMRSAFPISESIHGFPFYLRQAGYFTTNNVKTDYNTSSWKRLVEESWDESSDTAHWRNRPAESRDKPFFSVFNLMTSHQSRTMVWTYDRFVKEVQSRLSPEQIHDPATAPLPPYYPDTPVIRRTVARFYDCVTAMDMEVGALLQQLDEDGLADDTIVFFYSDHGSGMPRHKRALLDSGMHVPLLIRFPEKYRHLAPAKSGETTDRLVSFVDFAPTVLNLAGLQSPDVMQGKPFLGKDSGDERQYACGHRDRVDEAIDLARSVRDKRYLYIRNYMPHLGYNQPTAWPDLGEVRHEFYRLTDQDSMTAPQWHFAGPTRAIEELYDCEADPLNLHNLAGSPDFRNQVERLRSALLLHVIDSRDLGFIPESIARTVFKGSPPWDLVRTAGFRSVDRTAFRAARTFGRRRDPGAFTQRRDPAERYWAAASLAGRKRLTDVQVGQLEKILNDPSAAVRIAAAEALARHQHLEKSIPVLIEAVSHDDLTIVLHAARTIELLGDTARAAIPAMQTLLTRAEQLRPSDTPATFVQSGDQDLAMFASFAARGFLKHVRQVPRRAPGTR